MAIEDKKLVIKRQFLRYIHPLKSITNDLDQKECWIEQMKYLVLDLKTLLNLSFKEFWSTVVFNKQATMGLCTFLQEAAPPHLMDQLPQDDDVLIIYNEIYHFAFKLLERLTTSSEDEENYISPHYMWSLLCNNNIISITMLFDICSIYGQSYKEQLEIIFKELFTCQKVYEKNLKIFIKITVKCLNQFQDKIKLDIEYDNDKMCQRNETSTDVEEIYLCMFEDIINFLLDTSCSISNFLEIYPEAAIFFYQEKLHLKIASFYHNVKPLIYNKIITMKKLEKFQEKLHASRLLLMKSVRQCLIHITTQITNKSENAVEEYLEIISELLIYDEFVNDYNFVYNLIDDIKECQKFNKKIDSIRYDYLLKSLELINRPYAEHKQKELQLELQTNITNMENAKLLSLINNVKDLLPYLEDGFIQKCLKYYNMDSEKVINMVLEDGLPLELTQYNSNLSLMSEYEDNATGYDPSIKRYSKELKKLKSVLDDKSFRNEMRPFYEKYNLTEITCAELESYYNDEHNDTFNEIEYALPEPKDKNKKIRPDVTPRVLIQKTAVTKCIQEESSDDESQQVLNFQPFCENPEEIRERQARKYAAKQSNKSNRSKPKVVSSSTTPSKSNVELNRQRKNKNKAFSGNHNRRNAARSKQQKGMF